MRRVIRRLAVAATAFAGTLLIVAGTAFAQLEDAPAQASGDGPSPMLVLLAAAGGGAALFLFVLIVFGTNAQVERDLRGRLGAYAGQPREQAGRFKNPLLRRFVRQAESVAEKRGLFTMIENALEQANVPLRPGEAIAGAIGLALVVGALAGLFTRSLIFALIFAGVVLLLASAAVQRVARRERSRFESQLPDTLNLVSTSLRAGYSLLQALEAVSSEAPEPTSREFGRALNETRLGRTPSDALKDIALRMESVDFDWAVLAISIQREVGGNLAEVLQTAAETMMHRNRLRREMKALTAEGRISAIVLGVLPVGIFAFLFFTNRSYLEPLFSSVPGIAAMAVAVLLMTAGMFWMSKIVKIEV
jgi:tight adherence protein B